MQYDQQDTEGFFTDFVKRQHLPDPHTLVVDLDLFRQQYPAAAQDLIKRPTKYYQLAKSILQQELTQGQKPSYTGKIEHYQISFEGNLGANFVTPRGLGSKMAN